MGKKILILKKRKTRIKEEAEAILNLYRNVSEARHEFSAHDKGSRQDRQGPLSKVPRLEHDHVDVVPPMQGQQESRVLHDELTPTALHQTPRVGFLLGYASQVDAGVAHKGQFLLLLQLIRLRPH